MTASRADHWLFGYGSLIWKADFAFVERVPAHIVGWSRRFWQGSHDHRGTPDAPGRVVTLIRNAGQRCDGMAYRLDPKEQAGVLAQLDYREKNGYERHTIEMQLSTGGRQAGLIYIATPDNFAHLGEASDADIAHQIAISSGPSGTNTEYLLQLHAALGELGANDAHVERLVKLVCE